MKIENPPIRFIHATLYGENGVNCRCTIAYQVTDVELVAGHDPLVTFHYAFGYCSPKDQFNRAAGRAKATERLLSVERGAFLHRYIGYQQTLTGLFLNALVKLPPVKQGMMGVPWRIAQTWNPEERKFERLRHLAERERLLAAVAGSGVPKPAPKSAEEKRERAARSKLSRSVYAQFVVGKVDTKDKEAVRAAMNKILKERGWIL
jgi:hypothetical protein